MPPVPEPILRALSLPSDPSKVTLSTSGLGSGFTSTGSIRAQIPTEAGPSERRYFVKTSADGTAAKEMFEGEYASLNAIADAVPGFCPRALAWGAVDEDAASPRTFFLATEFLDLSGAMGRSTGNETSATTLAARLGKLHSTPAPADESGRRRFGFPVPTFCGDTKQENRFRDSWAEFYAEERLMTILRTSETRNGRDAGLRELVEATAQKVVPRGNADRGKIVGTGREETVGDVVYDPSAVYGHSEYELGIMHMFGGFGSKFFEQYHRIVPKTEPVEEYEDRIRLYELYHHLNHHAIFGGGYRSGAVSIMQKLIRKYGKDE
ncbi:hypothetical protein N7468_009932 [Penicillium chermesinum]|uniref:protein-ribulosamine 3-kinase n=1 Tax=Penicillium chermesinum TaxID=63820 RepID=A0A9W9NDG4_9EURO|nr:uncharacterized protein N7468_009932 [Penicillium chermesinum]KAJ5216924.1 hypothetical protein N7468_009932 [Penicillium chermesinum]